MSVTYSLLKHSWHCQCPFVVISRVAHSWQNTLLHFGHSLGCHTTSLHKRHKKCSITFDSSVGTKFYTFTSYVPLPSIMIKTFYW